MKGQFKNQLTEPRNKVNLYLDPTTNTIVESYDVLDQTKGITSLDQIYNWPVYDLNTHFEAVKLAQQGESNDGIYHAFLDSQTEEIAKQYRDDVISGGEARYAALRSEQNKTVNIINIWTELQGRRDRKYFGKNLAKEVPVNNLVISVDRVKKPTGLTQIDEGQLTEAKILQYSRQSFTANKYGMKYVLSEESRLKNVHNVLQDAIYVAGNKIDQRASFDTITAANGLATAPTVGSWDSFVSGTSRSTNNPLSDIGILELNIEGTAVGGKLTRVGMHQLTLAAWLFNSAYRGTASAGEGKYDFEPGTSDLPGVPGVGLVKENGIQEGVVYAVDTVTEDATIHYYQGPQRMGSAHDEETGDDKYFIIDYHLAQLVQSQTGFQITNALATLLPW